MTNTNRCAVYGVNGKGSTSAHGSEIRALVCGAYLEALAGGWAAKDHDVPHHSRRMIIICTIVGTWLVTYVLKHWLFGRESFSETAEQYWTLYVPVFATHMLLAMTAIGLGIDTLYMGIHKFTMAVSERWQPV